MAAIVTDDERARITARAKTTAVDDHLVRITDDVLFALPAANLILHVYAGMDRTDCSRCCSGGPATLLDRQANRRSLDHAADRSDSLDKAG